MVTKYHFQSKKNMSEKSCHFVKKLSTHIFANSFLPWIFPPLNSFRTLVRKLFKFSLHKRNAETIWDFLGFKSSKRIVFADTIRGNTVCLLEVPPSVFLHTRDLRDVLITHHIIIWFSCRQEKSQTEHIWKQSG